MTPYSPPRGMAKVGPLSDIGSGAKDVGGSGDDADPQIRVVVEKIQRGFDSLGSLTVDRVTAFFAFDPDDENAVMAFGGKQST